MKYIDVLRLNKAMSLFNFAEAKAKLSIKVMECKVEVEAAVEHIEKQLKGLKENFKPEGFDTLKADLESQKKAVKDCLNEEVIDKEKVNIANMRLTLLQSEWDEKYKEAESELLKKSYNLKLVKLSEEELEILMKPRREVVGMSSGENQLVITNHFYADTLAALSPLIK